MTQSQKNFLALPANRQLWEIFNSLTNSSRAVGDIRKITVNGAFTALPDVTGRGVVINNTTGKDIKYRRGGAGNYVTIPDGSGKVIDVVANISEIQIANATDNTNVDVIYEVNGEEV